MFTYQICVRRSWTRSWFHLCLDVGLPWHRQGLPWMGASWLLGEHNSKFIGVCGKYNMWKKKVWTPCGKSTKCFRNCSLDRATDGFSLCKKTFWTKVVFVCFCNMWIHWFTDDLDLLNGFLQKIFVLRIVFCVFFPVDFKSFWNKIPSILQALEASLSGVIGFVRYLLNCLYFSPKTS